MTHSEAFWEVNSIIGSVQYVRVATYNPFSHEMTPDTLTAAKLKGMPLRE